MDYSPAVIPVQESVVQMFQGFGLNNTTINVNGRVTLKFSLPFLAHFVRISNCFITNAQGIRAVFEGITWPLFVIVPPFNAAQQDSGLISFSNGWLSLPAGFAGGETYWTLNDWVQVPIPTAGWGAADCLGLIFEFK